MRDLVGLSAVRSALSNGMDLKELVKYYLDRIEANRNLNAFVSVYSESALNRADELQKRIEAGKVPGRLYGMVIGLKDNIALENMPLGAASRILQNYSSPFSATAVTRLLEEDAIIIGRLNCDEFAMGSSNEQSFYGPARHPHDPERVPGGSSGGSATAVAAGLCTAALGSDTGGSIRQPAAFCGVVGLKPTYGRISRYGLIAYGSSFDQIGPIAATMEDTALLYEVMAGKDPQDATSSTRPVEPTALNVPFSLDGKVFAVFASVMQHKGIHPEIQKHFSNQIKQIQEMGGKVIEVPFPYLDYLVPTYYVLSTAEASSNLSRFDGIHYGYRSENAANLEETYRKSRSEGFGSEVKRRIMAGTFVLSSGYYDAYYRKAQQVRRLLFNETEAVLNQANFIISPTSPNFAFRIGENKDPVSMYLEDIFTVQANLTGHPAISIPMEKQQTSGLFSGLQITAARFAEADLMRCAAALIKKTE